MTTWYKDLKEAFMDNGEDFDKMVCTLTGEELHKEFNAGHGFHEGQALLS